MTLWMDYVPNKKRPYLGISDKTFKLGGDAFWKQLIMAKKEAPEEYELKKPIVAQSKEVAQKFFEFLIKEIK